MNLCNCCGERSPYHVCLRDDKSTDQEILNAFNDFTGIKPSSSVFCRACVRKILHIKCKIAELKLLCQQIKEEGRIPLKRSLKDSSPERLMSPLPKKAVSVTQPKVKELQWIAPKPPLSFSSTTSASPVTPVAELESFAKTSESPSGITTKGSTKELRVLPNFLQTPRRNESVDVLARFGFHAKVNCSYDVFSSDRQKTL